MSLEHILHEWLCLPFTLVLLQTCIAGWIPAKQDKDEANTAHTALNELMYRKPICGLDYVSGRPGTISRLGKGAFSPFYTGFKETLHKYAMQALKFAKI
jgi:hypothetical protein